MFLEDRFLSSPPLAPRHTAASLLLAGMMLGGSLLAVAAEEAVRSAPTDPAPSLPSPPLPPFLDRALVFLAEAQHESGGFGGGSHAHQEVRDPHAIPADPGTTAFTALAFLRAGNTPRTGSFQETVRRATHYLLGCVERAPEEGPQITTIQGTQPQSKLGQNIDTALAAQFFARVLPVLAPGDELTPRTAAALDKCLRKIQGSQGQSGSWSEGGWASVLQSSMMNNALEVGLSAGRDVDGEVLRRARQYQKVQVDLSTGAIRTEDSAGVSLYASAGNMRAVASEAKAAEEILAKAKEEGRVEQDAEPSAKTLAQAGAGERAGALADAWQRNEAAKQRTFDESLLSGFGNNGGEEFLSYMMTSESLVIGGGEIWAKWNAEMHRRLEKIQNPNGSWSGHHCITSPVFCTAAATLCLTAERDQVLLSRAVHVEVNDAR